MNFERGKRGFSFSFEAPIASAFVSCRAVVSEDLLSGLCRQTSCREFSPKFFFSRSVSLGWSGEESLPVLAVSAAKGRFNGNCSHFSDKI